MADEIDAVALSFSFDTILIMKALLCCLLLMMSISANAQTELAVPDGKIKVSHRFKEDLRGDILLVIKFENETGQDYYISEPSPENTFDSTVQYKFATDLPPSKSPRNWVSSSAAQGASDTVQPMGYPVAKNERVKLKPHSALDVEHPVTKYFPVTRDYRSKTDIYISWIARIEIFSDDKSSEPRLRRHIGGFYVCGKTPEKS